MLAILLLFGSLFFAEMLRWLVIAKMLIFCEPVAVDQIGHLFRRLKDFTFRQNLMAGRLDLIVRHQFAVAT